MLDFIKSYGFLFTTLVTSTIAITIYFKNKKTKQLSWDIYSWSPIVTKLNHDIKIYYKDIKEITDDLNMVLIKFKNTGNEPIKKDDFENDLFLKLLDSKVYDVNVSETKPEGLPIEVYKDENEVVIGIKPLLLNPKDEFTIKLLTDKLIPEFMISTRIVGGSIVEYSKTRKNLRVLLGVAAKSELTMYVSVILAIVAAFMQLFRMI
ncbi:hypothetical protein [Priestia megaterium]|uniref:hypothetical protein n=1 Tax=Priestia megaterium TaxID=1404 RepID=UPI00112A2EDD|nr:hypothetical protein [Priestia megaterium]TPF18445.1 hypothetical protein CBE78_04255 [Priestia megaterium]TPF22555.1 hypothetical protein CBE79_06765 [Priestia megaterium]